MLDWERLGKTVRTMVWLCTKRLLISQKRDNQWKISVPPHPSCLHNQLFLLLVLLGRERGPLLDIYLCPPSLFSSDILPSELRNVHSSLDFSTFTSYILSIWPGSQKKINYFHCIKTLRNVFLTFLFLQLLSPFLSFLLLLLIPKHLKSLLLAQTFISSTLTNTFHLLYNPGRVLFTELPHKEYLLIEDFLANNINAICHSLFPKDPPNFPS